jgi:hypothetical protein
LAPPEILQDADLFAQFPQYLPDDAKRFAIRLVVAVENVVLGHIHSRKHELLDPFGRASGRAYSAHDPGASDFRMGFRASINKTL